jgi:proteasome lid subunit RPN8/RPN11
MDPESEARIKDQVEQNNQKILGWYHSHATFDVIISSRNIY